MLYQAFIKFLLWMVFDFTIRKCCGSQLPDFRVSHSNKCWQKDSFFMRKFGISLQQCVNECDNRRKCKSISYRSNMKLCELIPTTPNLDGSSTVEGPCTIVLRDDIKSQNNCSCDIHEVCNPKMGKCSVEECAPFSITNGTFLGNMNVIGSRVKFTCNPGTKEENGQSISTCLANGTWSVNPQCSSIECSTLPETPINGSQTGSDTSTGGIITFSCDVGFVLVGSPSTTCLDTGLWENASPTCRAGCVSSCENLDNGDYQSCNSCHVYVTCSNGLMTVRPCSEGLVWNDDIRGCDRTSPTC